MSDPFIGQIMQVGFTYAPVGWLQCAGQILPISQNQALFALLGTNFGGDGVNTYGIPDVRSRVMVGAGQGPGLSNYIVGETTGGENNVLTLSNLPQHNHTAVFHGTAGATTASGTLSVLTAATTTQVTNAPAAGSQLSNGFPNSGPGAVKVYAPAGSGTTAVNIGGLTVTGGSFTPQGTVTTGATGNNFPVPNIQPSIGIFTIIATVGMWPSRD